MATRKTSNASAVQPPTRTLTFFLLKKGQSSYETALDATKNTKRHPLRSGLPFQGAVFLAPQSKAQPTWLEFLQAGAASDLGKLFNASTSAVLFITVDKRDFALTFGYGRSLLNPEAIEHSFGLRVVLNTVDENGLKSVDTKTVQELTVHTRRQVSKNSRLTEFAVDKECDLLGSMAGEPADSEFASMVSGADGLHMRTRLEFDALGKKCRAVLRAYRSDEYKKRGFEFVDHVRTVMDPGLIDLLDAELLADITARKFDGMHMAPPEIVSWESIEGFSFVKAASPEGDLNLGAFLDQIRNPSQLTVHRLKHQRVLLHSANATEPAKSWPVYRTIVAEKSQGQRRFVLSGGEWFEIDKDFATRIAHQVAELPIARLGLPAAKAGADEGSYNRDAANGTTIVSVDKKCARIDGDPIELCDLYTAQRQFVHVKRWKASSTLSHLFAQGRISAETLISDDGFREEARQVLGKARAAFASHIPKGRPDPKRFQVVFAIIKDGAKGWRRSLPFFSQLNLVRTAAAIRNLGFEVRLERIDVRP